MGGGFSFNLKLGNGLLSKVSGKIVGMSGEDSVDIDVKDHSDLPNGVYSVPSSKGAAVKAILSNDALKGIDKSKAKKIIDDVFVDIADLKPAEPAEPDTPEIADTAVQDDAVSRVLQHNKEVLERAPELGRASQEFIDAVNEDGRFVTGGYGEVKTTAQQVKLRKSQMLTKIAALRNRIQESKDSLDPLEWDARIFDTVLEKSDEEIMALVEDTALKIARARLPGARVWGKMSLLDKVLEEGYRPKNDTAAEIEGGHLRTLTGTRGAIETQSGIPLDSGLRPIYGTSDYTFWEEARQRFVDEKDMGDVFRTDLMLSVSGADRDPLINDFAGNCNGYGDMEFILRPEVDERSIVHFGDSLLHKGWGVSAAGATDEEAIESVVGHLGDGDMNRSINTMLRTAITGDFVTWNVGGDGTGAGTYTETQVVDGFNVDDIEAIRLPGKHVYPDYKDQFNPDGVDGAELISNMIERFFPEEKLISLGFTPQQIEYAKKIFSSWIQQNSQVEARRNQASKLASPYINDLILALEREKLAEKIKIKAPNAKLLFGTSSGVDLENPESYGGKPGDNVLDILAGRVIKDVLSDVNRMIKNDNSPDDDDVEI